MTDFNTLSYWFPKVADAGLPVPNTVILQMSQDAREAIFAMFDGREAGHMGDFIMAIDDAAKMVGYPAFLRTGHTSAKHNWSRSCFLEGPDRIGAHIMEIVEYSEICGMMGDLPWTEWVVREMLPTMPVAHCPDFGGMPVCREFRFFVDGPEVVCFHPYWPANALRQGGVDPDDDFDYAAFCSLSDQDLADLTAMASNAGSAVGGAWSVDLLETKRGWFLTDMAVADRSFHWEGCEHNRWRTA